MLAALLAAALSASAQDDSAYRRGRYSMAPAVHYQRQAEFEAFRQRNDAVQRYEQDRVDRANAAAIAAIRPPSESYEPYRPPPPAPGFRPAPVPPDALREFKDTFISAVKAYLAAKAPKGALEIADPATREVMRLRLLFIHADEVKRISPTEVVGRADFQSEGGPRREVELDFRLKKDWTDWEVADVSVRSINGRSRLREPVAEPTRKPAPKPPPAPASPANLSAEVAVETPTGDGKLTGGQTGKLRVTVTNAGPGPAYGVKLVLDKQAAEGVDVPSEVSLGDLKPGETASADAALSAAKTLKRGTLKFVGTVVEGNGFDTEPALIEVPTEAGLIDVDPPPAAKTPRAPKAYAVVIGVEKYRDVRGSEFSSRDAQTVRDYLVKSMGYSPENVVLLQDERAGLADLATYLGPWLADRAVTKDSRVLVYYAGHGTNDPRTGEAFLVPYDGDPAYPQTKAFPLRKLYETLGALPVSDAVVVLDACFSGAGGRSVAVAGARPLAHVRASPVAANTVLLAAAQGDQISASLPAARHGLMTYFLLRGLRGEADADGDGKVTTRELFNYAAPLVEADARARHIEQRPVLEPPADALGPKGGKVWIVAR